MFKRKSNRGKRILTAAAGVGAVLGGLVFWRKRRARGKPSAEAGEPGGGESGGGEG